MALFRRRFTPQGAPPGAVAPAEEASVPPRITVASFDAGDLNETEIQSVDELVLDDGRVTWIDVSGLGDGSVVTQLGERLGLHPLALSDVVNVGQRPKVDEYDGALFIVLRMVTLDGRGELVWQQTSLFLLERVVVTFQESPTTCLEPLRARIRGGRKLIRSSGPDYLASMVVDSIVDGYFPVLEHFGEQLEVLEDQVLDEQAPDVLMDLYTTKRELAGLRRVTWPLRDALHHLVRDEQGSLSSSARLHLRDTLDHVMQVVEVTESYRELATSLVDVHLSMVGQRTNDVMRVLTVVSTIFIPLTFVAGVYGMNFDTRSAANLPELGWKYGYLFFWGVCAVMAIALLVLFRRLGWLRR